MATKKAKPQLPDEAAAFALALAKANGHPEPEAYVEKVRAAFAGETDEPAPANPPEEPAA